MSEEFLAQKGAAAPATTHPGGAARFHARRTIVLPPINLNLAANRTESLGDRSPDRPPRTARLTEPAATEKRKFTFRIDPMRHAAFCRAAESRNVSRQRLLTDALDDLLRRLDQRPDQTGSGTAGTSPGDLPSNHQPNGAAPLLPGSAAALPLPF